ncbi:MAG: ZIP family metal transporter [Ignavibacteriaceae bacterium]|nr:ZIP family metal transporter [Ignavibacteriaceae bacterium]
MDLLTLVYSLIALLTALLGALMTFLIKLNHYRLCSLISFSAGSLIAASFLNLLPESYNSIGPVELTLSVASGYLIFFFINKYYSHVCPACSASHFDEKTTKKFSEIFLTLFTALAFHSFLDGIAIAAGEVHSHNQNSSIFLAISIHKFPEGLALAALMLGASYSKLKIFVYVFLVELTTVVGAFTGNFFLRTGIPETLMGILLAHIAGGFIFLALHAVLGEMLKNHKKLVIFSMLSGFMLIFLASVLLNI